MRRLRPLLPLLAALLAACAGGDDRPRLVLATTHTLEDSGILDTLITAFRSAHPEHALQVVVSGSGEALEFGRRGDADVLLTHAPAAEERLARGGWIVEPQRVMHNDFVLLGPAADPVGVRDARDAVSAFRRLRDARAPFVSRGDDSGTHQKELSLWQRTGIMPQWERYIEAGVGMAEALRLAAARESYILADRATWLTLRDQLRLQLLFEGDSLLLNRYTVSRSWRPRNAEGAHAFAAWITGADAQRLIGDYGRDRFPEALFVPDAVPVR